MFKKIKKLFTIIFLMFLSLILLTIIYCIANTSKKISLTSYEIEADIDSPIRIVQLTDLHQAEFGKDNSVLVELVKEQNPDIIVMTGDMQNRDDENLDIVCDLIEKLSEITDVYFGYGNHEVTWEDNFDESLTDIFSEAGAIVVNNNYIDTKVNGCDVRIGGYMGYYRQPHMFRVDAEQKKLELQFADDFEATTRYKILLNHVPTAWVDWNYIDKYPVDLVLCGHYHGGQAKLPFLGALYAPYIGWFPENTEGVFYGEKAICVLSTGLGSEHFIPRVNNSPEVVVADLVPALN